MECIVKIYRKYSHPDYPNGGLFTSYFENNIEVIKYFFNIFSYLLKNLKVLKV